MNRKIFLICNFYKLLLANYNPVKYQFEFFMMNKK
jgi:hypothetical protein